MKMLCMNEHFIFMLISIIKVWWAVKKGWKYIIRLDIYYYTADLRNPLYVRKT